MKTKLITKTLLSTLVTGAFCSLAPALAGSYTDVAMELPEFNPWLVRARAIAIMPDESASKLTVIGGEADSISTEVVPEIDITYFFNSYIAAELVLATAQHDVKATGTALGKVDLGDVRILPPTLTLQYHPLPEGMFSPYIGAGINYTHFFDESSGPVATSITYRDSMGPALQAGLDIYVTDNWLINIDAKKVFIDTTAHVTTAPTTTIIGDVKINPWILGAGVGYRF